MSSSPARTPLRLKVTGIEGKSTGVGVAVGWGRAVAVDVAVTCGVGVGSGEVGWGVGVTGSVGVDVGVGVWVAVAVAGKVSPGRVAVGKVSPSSVGVVSAVGGGTVCARATSLCVTHAGAARSNRPRVRAAAPTVALRQRRNKFMEITFLLDYLGG